MSESAAHLVDQVFPRKPLRQWVLSFPFQLVIGEVLSIVNRAISTHLLHKAGLYSSSLSFQAPMI